MNQDYDKSCCIPHGEAILTPERAAKGDIAITNTAANGEALEIKLTVKNILNYLYEEEIITEQNWCDAHTFKAWQDQHQVAMGVKKAISNEIENSATNKLRAHGFVLLIRKLSTNDLSAIEFAINTFATSHTKFIVQNRKPTYRVAFERLSAILPPIRERVEALEALNEIDRKELSENNLKKLLASIKKGN